ncbi:hypothetical protein [Aquimarina brevivitae]|uniref:PH (Pleckstrin Homology) domain-containing protein n=1 Tax=Aquimarina brevivitae TaxID=323412 RepID=A0A4Q7P379_9FLAO|nr:hypothetical protein [Aquimarina brevivitae]RZS93132.1 hypothetical protein EV197_1702 [Aquimarina brevivitae]
MKGNRYAPNETVIKISKVKLLTESGLNVFLSFLCLYFAFSNLFGLRYLSLLLLFLFSYTSYHNIKKYKQEPKVQLRLSNKGLIPKNEFLITWSEILNIKVTVKPNYTSWVQKEYLVVNTNNSKMEFFINDLDITALRLEYLIKIYRNRFEQNNE